MRKFDGAMFSFYEVLILLIVYNYSANHYSDFAHISNQELIEVRLWELQLPNPKNMYLNALLVPQQIFPKTISRLNN